MEEISYQQATQVFTGIIEAADNTDAEDSHGSGTKHADREPSLSELVGEQCTGHDTHELTEGQDHRDGERVRVSGQLEEVGAVVVGQALSDELLHSLGPEGDQQTPKVDAGKDLLELGLLLDADEAMTLDSGDDDGQLFLYVVALDVLVRHCQDLFSLRYLVLLDEPP